MTRSLEDVLLYPANGIDTKAVRQCWTREQATAALMLVAFDEAEHLDDLRCTVEAIKARLDEMIEELGVIEWQECQREENRAHRRR